MPESNGTFIISFFKKARDAIFSLTMTYTPDMNDCMYNCEQGKLGLYVLNNI